MEDPTHQTFPEVPEDLCRLIFEVATEENDCRPTYALISKVEPIVYREVVASEAFHRTVVAPVSSKPQDFFALNVKSLMFEMQEDSLVADILGRCTSIQSLALWYNFNPTAVEVRETLTTPLLSPTHLSLSQFIFGEADTFSYPVFAHVTHLDISCPDCEDDWPWGSLGTLVRLTHLSVDVYNRPEDPIRLAETILRSSPSDLRVLILCICFSPGGPAAVVNALKTLARGDVDPRVVIAPYNNAWLAVDQRFSPHLVYEDLFRAWSTPSKGNTLWTRANQVVRERRSQGSDRRLQGSK